MTGRKDEAVKAEEMVKIGGLRYAGIKGTEMAAL